MLESTRFRKKPVEVEAMRFTTNNENGSPTMDGIINWINQGRDGYGAWHNGTDIFIKTLEGEMRATVGDWIIRGVQGEFYPCKPDIFDATYEGCLMSNQRVIVLTDDQLEHLRELLIPDCAHCWAIERVARISLDPGGVTDEMIAAAKDAYNHTLVSADPWRAALEAALFPGDKQ
jgi:hypothetical protein